MSSTKEYLDYIMQKLSGAGEITYRKMMGEYILYYRGKIIGGIYDNRLLIKPVSSAIELLPDAKYEIPYEGAKEMLRVNNVDNEELLVKLVNTMYEQLPSPKKK